MNVYADNAATTRMSQAAVDAMLPFLRESYGNPSSLYTLGQKAAESLQASRETMAKYLGCDAREITFTSGGSEADNQALLTAATLGARKGKKHIISTTFEHHAVLHTLKRLEKQGFEVTLLDVHADGLVSAQQIADAIRDDTCLVTIMFANNEIGTIEPIRELAAAAHEASVAFHTDAVQAFGHEPIDVNELGIDMLSASSHKIYGPKGVGLLYVRRGVKLQNLLDGGQQERGRRGSTENVPGIVGFARAAELAAEEIAPERDRQLALRDHAIRRILEEIPSAKLNGSWESRLANNVNFSFEFIEGEGMLLQLATRGICVSSGSACTSGSLDPSHVLLAIGLPHEIAHGSLRMTLGRDTTREDVDFAVDSLKATLQNLRMMSPLYEDFQQGKVESVIERFKADGFPYAN